MILERGTILNNRYRIVEILGQGGMGSVYKAVDENLGTEVAVKDNLFTTDEYARQFRREAIILANLRHPNLPRVTDHFVITGQGQYLVMDYIEGEDLRQRMERVGTIPEEDAIIIGAAVCDALNYLGTRKPAVIHRDIKPGNVRITPQGEIFLVDFGLVKTMQGSQATTTGARAMTPGFSPPEQYGTARTDQRSDIFSLGATLYAALSGATPEDALARAMDQAELTSLRKHNPRVSRRMASVLEKALEVRPDDRYQTADEFKQALLSASSSARRRDGDYTVAPPPGGDKAMALAGLEDEDVHPAAPGEGQGLAASVNLEELDVPPARGRRRKQDRRVGCWLVLLAFVLLAVGAGAYIYRFDQGLPGRVAGLAAPWMSAYLPVTTTAPVPLPTDTATATLEQLTATLAEVLPASTLTPTFTATMTPEPTATLTPQPTPFGGGTGLIAFASNVTGVNQVYVISTDGSERRQITDFPEGACQPSWAPDGQRLAFISPCANNADYYPDAAIYLINLDGSGLLPLPTLSGGDFDPAWSPDGKSIAFTSLRSSNRAQIYVLNLDNNSVIGLSDKYSIDLQPSWSQDGKQIIYTTQRRDAQEIWVMDANGQNPRQFSRSPDLINVRPSWAPDMQTVIFTQMVAPGSIPRVLISPYKYDTYTEYRVGQVNMPMRDAVYSPDGFWIGFEGWEVGGNHNLYIISATGAGLFPVTDDQALEFDPAWQPR